MSHLYKYRSFFQLHQSVCITVLYPMELVELELYESETKTPHLNALVCCIIETSPALFRHQYIFIKDAQC